MLKVALGLVLWLLAALPAQAQFATSSHYQLEIGDNLESNWPTRQKRSLPPAGVKSAPLVGGMPLAAHQLPPALITSQVGLSTDQTKVDFGKLLPGNLLQRQTHLTVVGNHPLGYRLYAYQRTPFSLQRPPANAPDNLIPATHCDDGTCTVDGAGSWQQSSTLGFGYTVSGEDAAADFAQGKAYRPFPLVSATATTSSNLTAHQALIASSNLAAAGNRQLTISYQLSVPHATKPGLYLTSIDYMLIPNY